MDSLQINPLGINHQARAVLHMIDHGDGINASWNDERKDYDAHLRWAPYYGARETGFIIWDRGHFCSNDVCPLAFVCVEHRNTDSIVIGQFEWDNRWRPPNANDFLDSLPADVDKYSMWITDFSFGEVRDAADWIVEHFEEWYQQRTKAKEKAAIITIGPMEQST